MPFPPYPCTGFENAAAANLYVNGVWINAIQSSRCHVQWWCDYKTGETGDTWTWDWRDGDPDAPPEVPEDPPAP